MKKRREKEKKRRVLWVFHSLIHFTPSREVVLPNVLLKPF
jgi:hypothetical protein